MRIEEHDIEEIKRKVNIVDVISKYVNVVKKGKNYLALCPFHNDTNPSMNISQEKQIYKCFSCGAGGNVFTFVQEFEKVNYPTAVRKVADFIGYDLSKYDKFEVKVDKEKEELYDLIKNASEFYNFCLETEDGVKGKEYFDKRNINDEVIKKFKLGYAPSDSSKIIMFLTRKGYTVKQIEEAGIGINRNGSFQDRFQGRVIFSLTDLNGRIVGFSGRKIDKSDAPKYVNTNETTIFKKGECLYNFYEAKNASRLAKKIYVVEGFMDVIALHKVGLDNAVATMGTALSKEHIKALSSLNVDVVVSFDGDDAGQNATYNILSELRKTSLNVTVTKANEHSKDLDEIFNEEGKEGVLKFINDTGSIYEFLFYYMLKKVNLDNYSDKAKFVRDFSKVLLSEVKDTIIIDHFINLMSDKLGYSKELIKENIDKISKTLKESKISLPKKEKKTQDRYYKAEIEIINQMLYDVRAIQYYESYLGYMYDTLNKRVATYILEYYRQNNNIDVNDFLKKVEETEPSLAIKIKRITKGEALPRTFNKQVFDVIKIQKPIQIEIDKLNEEYLKATDFMKKSYIIREREKKKKELQQLKSQFVVEKEN